MDWIHCNQCYVVPRPGKNLAFCISTCGHIFCGKCQSSLPASKKCVVCGQECTTTELNSQVKPEVREFFNDPVETIRKIQKIMEFQNSHREQLIEHLFRTNTKYQALKLEFGKMKNALRKAQDESRKILKANQALKEECHWLKERERACNRFAQSISPAQRFCDLSPQINTDGFQRTNNSSQHQLNQEKILPTEESTRLATMFRDITPRSSVSSKMNPLPDSSGFSGMYRNHNSLYSSTPSPGCRPAAPSVLSNLTPENVYNGGDSDTFQRRSNLPSNATPTEALKILSIAYGNKYNR